MTVLSKCKKSFILSVFLRSFATFALCAYLLAGCSSSGSVQEKFRFAFNEKGTFKIVQFTDLHWGGASGITRDVTPTIATIKSILEIEKPDIVVITGDISNTPDSLAKIGAIFEAAKIPFTITLGNHDGEAKETITRPEIFDFMMTLPYFVGDKGPEDISGTGNFVIPVYGKDNKAAALLYCFDSNSYPKNKNVGNATIHFDQIQWYREQGDKYAAVNDGKPLPSLAFFHIPLPEYSQIRIPSQEGEAPSPEVRSNALSRAAFNTGAFASFVEQGDIMGVFVGHVHSMSHAGVVRGIVLGYGRFTGWNAGSHVPDPYVERGARIIELREGEFAFDTWLRTAKGVEQVFHYPADIASQ